MVAEGKRPWLVFSWLGGASALFCKEMAATYPLAVILWDAFFLPPGRGRRGRWGVFLLLSIIIIGLSLIQEGKTGEKKYGVGFGVLFFFLTLLPESSFIYNREGMHRQAKEVLDRALSINPSHPEVMMNLAIALKNLGDLSRANDLCRAALALAPGYPEGHNAWGDVLRLAGKTGEAQREYRAALKLNPGLSEARNNLANLDLLAAGRIEPNAAAEARAGLILALVKKDADRARPHLLRALELDPNLPERAAVEKALGRQEKDSLLIYH